MQPKAQTTAPEIDGLKESSWNTYNSTPIQLPGGKFVEIYSMYHNEQDGGETTTYIYFGLLYKEVTHEALESFALFLSEKPPDSSEVTNLWTYDDIKVVRLDGVSYDQEIISDEERSRNDTINDIEFAVSNNSKNETFYEMRFPISTNRTDDVNWTVNEAFSFKLFFGNTYGSEVEDYQPEYENWEVSTRITLEIGIQDEGGLDTGKWWWENLPGGDFNSFVSMLVFFVIAIVMFVGIGYYNIIGARKRMGRRR